MVKLSGDGQTSMLKLRLEPYSTGVFVRGEVFRHDDDVWYEEIDPDLTKALQEVTGAIRPLGSAFSSMLSQGAAGRPQEAQSVDAFVV